MGWKDVLAVLNTVSAFIILIASVWLARFKFSLMEDLRQEFMLIPKDPLDFPFTRREALPVKKDIQDLQDATREQWRAINDLQRFHNK